MTTEEILTIPWIEQTTLFSGLCFVYKSFTLIINDDTLYVKENDKVIKSVYGTEASVIISKILLT